MNEEKQKILEFSQDYFLQNGFYRTTMDEIASSLRMSKKTIYKHYPSKDELIKEVVHNFMKTHETNINRIVNENDDAILKLKGMIDYLSAFVMKVKEKWISDLRTYTPGLWEEIDNFRIKFMNLNFSKIIKQGQKEGYFIHNSPEIIVNIIISSIRGTINPDFILHNKFSLKTALDESVEILFNGIMTERGKKYLKKLSEGKKK